jgi:transcriptional regulator with XRE-family HTH domain
MINETFSEWLERQFALTDAYAKDIARSAKLSEGYLSGLRKAKRGSPSATVADRVAEAFANARELPQEASAKLREEARQASRRSARPAQRTAVEEELPSTLMSRLAELHRRRPLLLDRPWSKE